MRDPGALQDTPARKILMDAIAKAKAASGGMGTVGNVASNAERISQAINPAPPPAGSAQAAPAPAGPAPFPTVPGVSIGQGAPQAPLQALSNLMPPSGPPAAPTAPGSVPPIPMPKRFAEPIAPPAPAVGAWQTEVKKPETGITAGNVQQFLRDWAAGAAGNTKSPVGAFFTGAHGSFESQAGREREAKKTAAATEERTFERGLKTSQERRSEAKAKREARESDIKMSKLQAEIKKLVDPALGLKERGEILTRAMKYYNGLKDAPIDEGEKRKLLKDFVKQDETYMQEGTLPTFGATGEPVKVSTPDEAMKLAPGTKCITPDGKVKVR